MYLSIATELRAFCRTHVQPEKETEAEFFGPPRFGRGFTNFTSLLATLPTRCLSDTFGGRQHFW